MQGIVDNTVLFEYNQSKNGAQMNKKAKDTFDVDRGEWGEYPQLSVSSMAVHDLDWNDIAILARRIHGLLGWQGVQSVHAHAGLSHLLNLWLHRNGHKNAYVYERYLGDKESLYTPSWK